MGIQQNGDLRQCCQMVNKPFGKFIDENNNSLKFSHENVDLSRNHKVSKQIRKEMLAGQKPSACSLCWKEESIGIFSKRKSMLKQYDIDSLIQHTESDGTIDLDKTPLNYLDLRLGNLCNLKCRSCGPGDSSLWVDDFAELTQKDGKVIMNYYGEKNYDIIKKSTQRILNGTPIKNFIPG